MPQMRIEEFYEWEVETDDHEILRQYAEDGQEVPSESIPAERVIRASIIHHAVAAPRHDILIDPEKGEKFVRHFGRGIIKYRDGEYRVVEYLHCLETNRYRLWIFSRTGQTLVTNVEFEVYL